MVWYCMESLIESSVLVGFAVWASELKFQSKPQEPGPKPQEPQPYLHVSQPEPQEPQEPQIYFKSHNFTEKASGISSEASTVLKKPQLYSKILNFTQKKKPQEPQLGLQPYSKSLNFTQKASGI